MHVAWVDGCVGALVCVSACVHPSNPVRCCCVCVCLLATSVGKEAFVTEAVQPVSYHHAAAEHAEAEARILKAHAISEQARAIAEAAMTPVHTSEEQVFVKVILGSTTRVLVGPPNWRWDQFVAKLVARVGEGPWHVQAVDHEGDRVVVSSPAEWDALLLAWRRYRTDRAAPLRVHVRAADVAETPLDARGVVHALQTPASASQAVRIKGAVVGATLLPPGESAALDPALAGVSVETRRWLEARRAGKYHEHTRGGTRDVGAVTRGVTGEAFPFMGDADARMSAEAETAARVEAAAAEAAEAAAARLL
jgi:hypothetical protein